MQFNTLGRTDIKVTDICLGTMTWGSQNTEAEGHAQIAMARDAGINFMDTAEVYAVPGSPETSGRTEEIIGNWFAANKDREKWVLATKIVGGGSAHIRDGRRPGDMVREGKIRQFGLSNESTWGIAQWLKLSEQMDLPRVVSVQNEYSLIRRIFDHDLAELSHHEDVGLLAYSPLAGGMLTGKYFDGATPKGSRKDFQKGFWRINEYSEAATRAYHAVAARHGLDPIHMAIAFCRSRPFMTSTIIGATSTEQLTQVLAAKDLTLAPEVLADIDATFRAHPRPL